MYRLIGYIILCTACFACKNRAVEQPNGNYRIDPSLNENCAGGSKVNLGTAMMESKRFVNGKEQPNFSSFLDKIPAITYASLKGDTMQISGIQTMGSWGFTVYILGDSCWVTHKASNRSDPLLKLDKQDKDFSYGIEVPAKSFKLHLNKKPALALNETICGRLSYESNTYFSKRNQQGDINEVKMESSGTFSATITNSPF